MKETRLIMGMPIEIEIVPTSPRLRRASEDALEEAFAYLVAVDERFSTYKEGSEISRINRGEITPTAASVEMREVFALAEKTKKETNGYFDIKNPTGHLDPSGIVKGWAILNTAALIRKAGHEHFMVNAGGDIATGGKNAERKEWSVGIRNPFKTDEIIKVVYPRGKGIATSGSYIRGAHIYNPHAPEEKLNDIVSITVIGPDALEADRFATAAFAMGKKGVEFIESLPGFEAYAIDARGVATLTSGFGVYTR
ncbi:MAG: FAD:protein FMN transferase [Minisyncoccota bacterium]